MKEISRPNRTSAAHHVSTAVKSALTAAAVLGGIVLAGAGTASASSDGCTYSGHPVDRCVFVDGSGTYVNEVTGRIIYETGLFLEIEVWGDGIYYRGHGSQGTPSDTTEVTLPINRNLQDGSWVCATARWVDGSQSSPACVQIHG